MLVMIITIIVKDQVGQRLSESWFSKLSMLHNNFRLTWFAKFSFLNFVNLRRQI